jgi:hypothetical protein
MWLWIDCPKFTVRVECDKDDKIKTLPPILVKRYKNFFGQPYRRFIHQLLHDYTYLPDLIIQEYDSDGFITERGWRK